jgi:hypothetical protein
VQPDKAFAFGNGNESSQTRYRWSSASPVSRV